MSRGVTDTQKPLTAKRSRNMNELDAEARPADEVSPQEEGAEARSKKGAKSKKKEKERKKKPRQKYWPSETASHRPTQASSTRSVSSGA